MCYIYIYYLYLLVMYSNIVSHYHANFDCPYLQHEREQVMTTNVWLTQVRQIIKKKNNNLTLNN